MNAVFATSIVQALYSFALMAGIAVVCAGVIKLIVSVLARSARPVPAIAKARPIAPADTSPAVLPTGEVPDELAVIIAAACHAAVGAHRIVFMSETHRAANWTAELRTRHHLSHVLHR